MALVLHDVNGVVKKPRTAKAGTKKGKGSAKNTANKLEEFDRQGAQIP